MKGTKSLCVNSTLVLLLLKIAVSAAAANNPVSLFPKYTTPTRLANLTFKKLDNTYSKTYDVRSKSTTHSQTYRSPPMPLQPGEVVFTNPRRTPLNMPTGNIAITSFHAEVVDEEGTSTPLSEVYNHHWLVFNGKGNAGVCKGYLDYVFGVGAESRGTTTNFPYPYGMVLSGTESWAQIYIY